jgi:hypothetical protein
VFYANGRLWRTLSYDGTGNAPWKTLAIATDDYDQIALGQFDSAAGADVLYPRCF